MMIHDEPPTTDIDLKRQIRQLESIAALSGGIAHDYNNLLTAIMGNLSLALEHVISDSELAGLLKQALAASRVARNLTQRLITFAKGGAPTKQPTDIVGLVQNAAAFSLSGSNIRCDVSPATQTWSADVDPQQIGQAIHHLMINAAEAMPAGGTVRIGFENRTLERPCGLLPPGPYIDITIKDQGVGIGAEQLDKIFDPYFSTKPIGADRGTGLGLSIADSIISRHGGEIVIASQVGVGTTVHVLIPASPTTPAVRRRSDAAPAPRQTRQPVYGRGKILVMDDEEMIRELAGNMLRHLGYEVDFAEGGQGAIRKYQSALEASAPYDAVILDLTIKGGMGGEETIKMLKTIDPQVKAIVSSGYSDNPVIGNYQDFGFCDVVAKPYEMLEFSQTLQRVMMQHE